MTDMNTGAAAAPKRPSFLTVLCILSFIGCALGLATGVWGYFSNKTAAASGLGDQVNERLDSAMDDAMTNGEMTDQERQMAESITNALGGGINFDNAATASLVGGLMCIVCFIGVFMMWNLKKTGFFIYLIGQVVSIAAPFIWSSGLGIFGSMFSMIGAIFPIIFVILYALNLKHMR